jgi:HPt (histidine-containing phosphotransfer) domain-containing protein
MQAARLGDRAALWKVCHSLRGACAVLCATRLVQHIEALEAALAATGEPAANSNMLLAHARPLQAALVTLARQLETALVQR